MRKTNSIITLIILSSVLLSGVCFSLIAAQDDQTVPEFPTAPNQTQINLPGEDSELIGYEITFESNLPLVAASIVLAIIVGVLSVIVCFIKFNDSRK